MALTLTIDCSHHQKDDGDYRTARSAEIFIDSIDDKARLQVERELKKDGWVVQYNGDNMDTYCSKTCAK